MCAPLFIELGVAAGKTATRTSVRLRESPTSMRLICRSRCGERPRGAFQPAAGFEREEQTFQAPKILVLILAARRLPGRPLDFSLISRPQDNNSRRSAGRQPSLKMDNCTIPRAEFAK